MQNICLNHANEFQTNIQIQGVLEISRTALCFSSYSSSSSSFLVPHKYTAFQKKRRATKSWIGTTTTKKCQSFGRDKWINCLGLQRHQRSHVREGVWCCGLCQKVSTQTVSTRWSAWRPRPIHFYLLWSCSPRWRHCRSQSHGTLFVPKRL